MFLFFSLLDVSAPHFNNTCPEKKTVIAARGEQDAVVEWTLDAADNHQDGVVNVTSSIESGTRLPEGNHTVIVRAWDSTGNMGSCEFVVTVKGKTKLIRSFFPIRQDRIVYVRSSVAEHIRPGNMHGVI